VGYPQRAPGYEVLEGLPYLMTCIKESARSPMLHTPVGDIVVDSYTTVPAGNNIVVAVPFVNLDPDALQSPREFRPERWLEGNERELGRYLVSFSRGARQCLGMKWVLSGYFLFELSFHSPDFSDAD